MAWPNEEEDHDRRKGWAELLAVIEGAQALAWRLGQEGQAAQEALGLYLELERIRLEVAGLPRRDWSAQGGTAPDRINLSPWFRRQPD